MSQLNDISLVAQVVVFKNTRAFDQLVQKYQSPVRRFFLHLTCGDSELSDDLAQDTFIKAYTNLASFRNLSSFSTWLYRIAYNIFYDYIRSRKETADLDTKEIYPTGSSGEINHIALNAYTCIVGRHPRHGGFVLSLLYPGLHTRPHSRRINGKFCHDKLLPYFIDCVNCCVPQKNHY